MPVNKYYGIWGGIDYRTNDLLKNKANARDCENTDINERGALSKRFGTTTLLDYTIGGTGVWGLGTWTNKSGVKLPVALIDDDLYIGNSEDATSFSAVNKVAYLSSLGADAAARLRGATFASMGGTLYIATGTSQLLKYDGEKLSLSGAPTLPINSVTTSASAGEWTATTVDYKFTYTIADKNGIITVGAPSDVKSLASKTAIQQPQISVPNLRELDHGVKVKLDSVASAVPPATISGTYNITLDQTKWSVGDIVFQEDPSAKFVVVYKLLEKVGVNTFRTDTLFNTVNIQAVSNIYITLARSIDGNPYQIAFEVVNKAPVGQTISDYHIGGLPVEQGVFDEPQNVGYIPLKPKYVSTHLTQLILSGIQDEPQSVYFSDILDQEAWSPNNSFIPGFNQVSEIKGNYSFQGALLTFTTSNIFQTSGTLDSAVGFRTDPYAGGNIGALNQNGITETDFGLVVVTSSGPWVIESTGSYPKWFGERVANYFIDRGGAVVIGVPQACWLPSFRKLLITGSDVGMIVFDAKSDTWHRWAGCNSASQSIAATNRTAYFVNQNALATKDRLRKFNATYTESSYNDDGAAISAYYKTTFDTISGEWSRKKKFLRLKLFRMSDSNDNIFTQAAGAFTVAVNFYYDLDTDNTWTTTLSLGDNTTAPFFAKTKLPNKRGYAISMTFANSENNKKMSLAGFEIELEAPSSEKVEG